MAAGRAVSVAAAGGERLVEGRGLCPSLQELPCLLVLDPPICPTKLLRLIAGVVALAGWSFHTLARVKAGIYTQHLAFGVVCLQNPPHPPFCPRSSGRTLGFHPSTALGLGLCNFKNNFIQYRFLLETGSELCWPPDSSLLLESADSGFWHLLPLSLCLACPLAPPLGRGSIQLA